MKKLEVAVLENLIVPASNADYKFVHDKVLQAVYETLHEDIRTNIHYTIGKLLLTNSQETNLFDVVFELVNHLNYGLVFVPEADRKQLVELNVMASLKAQKSSAYMQAFEYLAIAASLCTDTDWDNDYRQMRKIHNSLAELSYLTNQHAKTKEYADIVIRKAKKTLDKVGAYESLINSYRAQSEYKKSIDEGMKILDELGEKMPKNPTMVTVGLALVKLLTKVNVMGNKKIRELPIMTDYTQKAIARLLDNISASAYITNQNLSAIIVFKGINMSLKYGFHESTVAPMPVFGMMLAVAGMTKKGVNFSDLSYELQQKFDFESAIPKRDFVHYAFVKIWDTDIHSLIPILEKGYAPAMQLGANDIAAYSLSMSVNLRLNTGQKITTYKQNLSEYKTLIIKAGEDIATVVTLATMQIIDLLSDNDTQNYSIQGSYFNYAQQKEFLVQRNNWNALATISQYQLFLDYLSYTFDDTDHNLIEMAKYEANLQGQYNSVLTNFYKSLCMLAIYHTKTTTEQKKILKEVAKNQNKMAAWAKYAPANYQHKYHLVEAEKQAVLSHYEKAETHYYKAIELAAENNFTNEEALAYEALARFYHKNNKKHLAKANYQAAYKAYNMWGVLKKAQQLARQFPEYIIIIEEQNQSLSHSISNTASSTSSTKSGSLDLGSIIKASQSLSQSVKLEKLLVNMLQIIMENTGAEYVAIIRNDEGYYTVEAQGRHDSDISVLNNETLDKTTLVPQSIVNYTIRSRKTLVIDNAIDHADYSNNNYVVQNKTKSVLCHPVLSKNKLLAIIYLENNLNHSVFTQKRIETLNILSAQIAVSLENALLYENLEARVTQRTAELRKAKDEVEHSHKAITDSITYASRIQTAVMPTNELFQKHFADFFIIFRPRDVVSGDFYWIKQVDDYLMFTAADCTGHGVPGAFVSMLGISFLNEIVQRKNVHSSGEILDTLRREVKNSLHQEATSRVQSRDGIDMAFCKIHLPTKQLCYAGANNPLFIVRNKELIEIKANHQPIGIYSREKPFTSNKFDLQTGDQLYLFSDGYLDQFGGTDNTKFMKKRFKEMLLNHCTQPMPQQREAYNQNYDSWKGSVPQIDDVVLIGVRI